MENNPLLDISRISGKRGNKRAEEMQNFRLDRIADVTEDPVKVQMYCQVSVMKYFGTDFECEPVDAERFKATVSVYTSTTFYRWVFGFNGKIKIVERRK